MNITVDNVVSVSETLTNLVVNATSNLGDQNTDNIVTVSNILNEIVRLLSNTTLFNSSQVLMV